MSSQERNLQDREFGRDVFLKVLGIDATIWNQKSYRDEVGIAFGLRAPLAANAYGPVDLVAAALTLLLAKFLKVETKVTGALVRKHWLPLLEGWARMERTPPDREMSKQICFVVTMTEDKDPEKIRVAVGECQKAIDKVGGLDRVPHAIPLRLIRQKIRQAAETAEVDLPEPFTPAAPGTAAWDRWISDIHTYRRFANAETGGKKAKARKAK